MYKILLFAGTTEGRQIAEFLRTQSEQVCVFTATEYGGELIRASDSLRVESGRMDRAAMEDCFRANPGALVIDATHPYAAVVSETLQAAADAAGNAYWRVVRASGSNSGRERSGNIYVVPTVDAAVAFLEHTDGNILLTTGSKNLKDFARLPQFAERVYARILSVPASLAMADEVGLKGAHLMCMQGPFSTGMNAACIRHTDAAWLVTKEAGAAGGFPEKLEAAEETGCRVLVIGRPKQEQGMSAETCIELLKNRSIGESCTEYSTGESCSSAPEHASDEPRPSGPRRIALIGTGIGADMTEAAAAWCRSSDLLIGAKRIVDAVPHAHADVFYEYRKDEILSYLSRDTAHRKIAVLFSGDTGFFSGAAAFLQALRDHTQQAENTDSFCCFPGISSLSSFSARIGRSWEHAHIVSIHGRSANVISEIRRHADCFCLLGKPDDVQKICRELVRFRMDDVDVTVGERLGGAEERIRQGTPADFLQYENDPIAVMWISNPSPEKILVPGIPDEQFIRGAVPMTKEEVRTLAVSKLQIRADDLIWDVGAGTGSISVELARTAHAGKVYAVECNPEGTDLIRQNRLKFRLDNLEVIEGRAPEALYSLPAPDAALIGGSKGAVREIIHLLLQKNPSVRIVITAITLETVSAVLLAASEEQLPDPEIVQITTARARKAGSSHMMIGQNPIYLITFRRNAAAE